MFAKLITFKAFAEISLEKKILSERDITIEEEHCDEDFRVHCSVQEVDMGSLSKNGRTGDLQMLILKADQQAVLRAAKVVLEGGIVVYPTDTVYGVGCNPFIENAVRRIIDIKQRKKDPLPVLGSSREDLERIAQFNEIADRLASKFWPGPLTLVLEKKPPLSDAVTFGLPSVAVRVPNCDVALRLIEASGGLLVGTSANISGSGSCTNARDVTDQIGEAVDIILDGGETILKKESSIVRVDDDRIQFLRCGAISEYEIRSALS